MRSSVPGYTVLSNDYVNGAIPHELEKRNWKYTHAQNNTAHTTTTAAATRESCFQSISHILGARRSHSEEAAHFPLLDAIPHLIHALEVLWHLAGARAAARRLELQQFVGGLAAVLKVEEG